MISSVAPSASLADIGCLIIAALGILMTLFPGAANRLRLMIPGQRRSPAHVVRVLGIWAAVLGIACLLLLLHSGK